MRASIWSRKLPIGRLEFLLDPGRDAAAVVVMDGEAEGPAAPRSAWPMRPMPTMPRRFPVIRCPSMKVGDQPVQLSSGIMRAPSGRRRATTMMSAMVMSAVSSVSTPGVLVTVMPRESAACTSMLSTPLPKLAMSFRFGPAWARMDASMSSVTVGTSTSAAFTASTRSAGEGLSPRLRRVSNSSHMRVSTTSGRWRVTTTTGLFFIGSASTPVQVSRPAGLSAS